MSRRRRPRKERGNFVANMEAFAPVDGEKSLQELYDRLERRKELRRQVNSMLKESRKNRNRSAQNYGYGPTKSNQKPAASDGQEDG